MLSYKCKNKFTYYTASELLRSYISSEEKTFSAPPPTEIAIPDYLIQLVETLSKRSNDKEKAIQVILELCPYKPMKSKAIAQILVKSEKYILREFLKPLLNDKKLNYTIPDIVNHPNQAYITIVKTDGKVE